MSTTTPAIDIDDALIQEPRDGVFQDPPEQVPAASDSSEREQPQATSATADAEEHTRMRAYQLWQERGCPEGSADDDWYRAQTELMSAQG